jgi:hypothetical protein
MVRAYGAKHSGIGIPFGAAHRVNFDTPPLKGLRLEPFGSIRNRCDKSRSYAFPAIVRGSNRNRGSFRWIGGKGDNQDD